MSMMRLLSVHDISAGVNLVCQSKINILRGRITLCELMCLWGNQCWVNKATCCCTAVAKFELIFLQQHQQQQQQVSDSVQMEVKLLNVFLHPKRERLSSHHSSTCTDSSLSEVAFFFMLFGLELHSESNKRRCWVCCCSNKAGLVWGPLYLPSLDWYGQYYAAALTCSFGLFVFSSCETLSWEPHSWLLIQAISVQKICHDSAQRLKRKTSVFLYLHLCQCCVMGQKETTDLVLTCVLSERVETLAAQLGDSFI